jgi:hypothetical protein
MLRVLGVAMLALAVPAASLAAKPNQADEPEKAADKGEKMICKRFMETGSLVKGYRACKTKRDWEREREAARAVTSNSGSCASQGLSGGC